MQEAARSVINLWIGCSLHPAEDMHVDSRQHAAIPSI